MWHLDEMIHVKKYFEIIIANSSIILFVSKEFWSAVEIYIGRKGHSMPVWKQMWAWKGCVKMWNRDRVGKLCYIDNTASI